MKASSPIRILICAAHTGGHFFPALGYADTFKTEHPEAEIHMTLSRMPVFAQEALKNRSHQVHLIPLSAIPPFFSFKMLLFLLECTQAFYKTALLILKLKPRLVVGFGSYSSVAGVLCASCIGIPILLHEQNASFGRANRFLSVWANQVAVSFPETHGKVARRKVFYSGYPLRSSFLSQMNGQVTERNSSERFTILIFGGSQGARRLNQIFLEALEAFSTEEKVHLAVIHIVGNTQVHEVKQTYERLGISADVCGFSNDISDDFKRADLVIARAGAGTVFELAAVGRAAILIPYPHAYAHQKLNAEYLSIRQSARVFNEEDLSPNQLTESIRTLRKDGRQRADLARNIRNILKPDANHNLVQASWELACV